MSLSPDSLDLTSITSLIQPGDRVYIGNFGAPLYVVGHELIRQRVTDLEVVMGSGGMLLDQLIGAGTASRAIFAHCWGPIGPAPAWNFRRACEKDGGAERFRELSLGALHAALLGAAWGVPFVPVAAIDPTGYVTDDWSRGLIGRVESEFGSTAVVRSLPIDVAFVHAATVDQYGNAWINGPFGEALVAAQAATRTVVVAERVVEADPAHRGADLPGVNVAAVVECPGAVHPDGVMDGYARDAEAYSEYATASSTVEGFADWLEREVHRV